MDQATESELNTFASMAVTRPVVCDRPFLRHANIPNGAIRMDIVNTAMRSLAKSDPTTTTVTGGEVHWQGIYHIAH